MSEIFTHPPPATRRLRILPTCQVVDASLAKGSKGVKYALTARRWKLWLRLAEEMRIKEMVPCSWGFFWALTGTVQYELLKYDNC